MPEMRGLPCRLKGGGTALSLSKKKMKTPNWKTVLQEIQVPGSPRVWALAAACLVLLVAGFFMIRVSGTGARPGLLPAPGTMRLVTVERVEDKARQEARQNLLPGGEFRTWWAGAPAPQGVVAPDPGASKLEQADGIAQTWQKPEAPGIMNARMRLESQELSAGTYELEVLASGSSGGAVSVGLWVKPDNGAPAPVDEDFITLLPGEGQSKRYSRQFKLDKPGVAIFGPHALFGIAPDTRVVWHSLHLTRLGGRG